MSHVEDTISPEQLQDVAFHLESIKHGLTGSDERGRGGASFYDGVDKKGFPVASGISLPNAVGNGKLLPIIDHLIELLDNKAPVNEVNKAITLLALELGLFIDNIDAVQEKLSDIKYEIMYILGRSWWREFTRGHQEWL